MILNDIIAFVLIPSLINSEQLNETSTQNNLSTTTNVPFTHLTSGEDFLSSDNVQIIEPSNPNKSPSSGLPSGFDPLLADINEEVKRLDLEYPDDYFDHLEDQSDEVRKIIFSRQQRLEQNQKQKKQEIAGRSDDDDSEGHDSEPSAPSTTVPILIPSTSMTTESPEQHPTSKKPNTAIGSAISTIKRETGSVISTLTRPFSGARNLFKKSPTTTSTTLPPLPAPETLEHYEKINCTGPQSQYKDKCYNLLQSFPCQDNQWLIEDEITGKAKCADNPCHQTGGTALFDEKCVQVGFDHDCHPGMRTYIFRTGKVECDCKPGYLYNSKDANCYKAYHQGPCPKGQYFIIPRKPGATATVAECMPNPCSDDGSFCNAPRCPRKRNCEKFGSKCRNGEKEGIFAIYPKTNTPFCSEDEVVDKIIGNVPTLSCAPGSRRDILGNCRAPTNINFS